MLSSQIKSNEIVFGICNKDLLEEIIFYGIGLGADFVEIFIENTDCLLYTSPSPRDRQKSRMPSSA